MRLQQGFAASEMGFRGRFAQQQSWAAHVRFGSEADIEAPSPDEEKIHRKLQNVALLN